MNELVPTLLKGLTYDGDNVAMIINYGLIVLLMLPFILGTVVKRQAWILCVILMALIQVLLWFFADAIGVSLIWSGLAGFLGLTYYNKMADQSALNIGVLVIAVAAIIFYAVTYPILTTVAHVLAVILGAIIFAVTDGAK
jgi:hypothetical protein